MTNADFEAEFGIEELIEILSFWLLDATAVGIHQMLIVVLRE